MTEQELHDALKEYFKGKMDPAEGEAEAEDFSFCLFFTARRGDAVIGGAICVDPIALTFTSPEAFWAHAPLTSMMTATLGGHSRTILDNTAAVAREYKERGGPQIIIPQGEQNATREA